MCWTAEVSFVTASIQLGMIYYMYKNPRYEFLQWTIPLMLSSVVVESMEFFIWFFIASEKEFLEGSCHKYNVFFSTLLQANVIMQPLIHSLLMLNSKKTAMNIKMKELIIQVNSILSACMLFQNITAAFQGNWACSQVGPYGHQLWEYPALNLPATWIWTHIKHFLPSLKFNYILGFLLTYRLARTTDFVVTGLMSTLFLLDWFIIGPEADSFWCWQGIIWIATYLALGYFVDVDTYKKEDRHEDVKSTVDMFWFYLNLSLSVFWLLSVLFFYSPGLCSRIMPTELAFIVSDEEWWNAHTKIGILTVLFGVTSLCILTNIKRELL